MMLGTSYTTNKCKNGNVDSSSDDVNSLTDIGTNNGEHTITQQINVMLDDVSLERVNSTKFVGVIIYENLYFEKSY